MSHVCYWRPLATFRRYEKRCPILEHQPTSGGATVRWFLILDQRGTG
jgi:hypothetical protein